MAGGRNLEEGAPVSVHTSSPSATGSVDAAPGANVLEVRDLKTYIRLRSSTVQAVDGVSFDVKRGETVGVVGESGCGKTMTGMSIMRLLPNGGYIAGGSIAFDGLDLATADVATMQSIRGNKIGMVFQDPMTSLNPTMNVGRQIAEGVKLHRGVSEHAALRRATEVLDLVGMPRPQERLKDFPHQLSGGLRQRVMIAMALACDPELLIADEPTTALDVTIQAQILALLDRLQAELGMGMILITHDMGVIAGRANRTVVMYAGQVVENADTEALFARMRHPYTEALLASIPQLDQDKTQKLYSIPGLPPDLTHPPTGCRFAPRCLYATEECVASDPPLGGSDPDHPFACFHPRSTSVDDIAGSADVIVKAVAAKVEASGDGVSADTKALLADVLAEEEPVRAEPAPTEEATPVLDFVNVSKEFTVTAGALLQRKVGTLKAVTDVSVALGRGETLGVVGESGCGKTTLGRMGVALEKPTEGRVLFDGQELNALGRRELRNTRQNLQLMFQDPYASLDPRMRVDTIVGEPLTIRGGLSSTARKQRIRELIDEVGLPRKALSRFPHEFSGGQRQRIGLARALALSPKVIVADEPVSALDVSIRSQILNLMKRLQAEHDLSYLFISHDLSVVRYLADRIAVMYLGKLVEIGTGDDIYLRSAHPYTAASAGHRSRGQARGRAGQDGGGHHRRAAVVAPPAVGMPVPHPLPPGPGGVRRGRARAAHVRWGTPGGVPFSPGDARRALRHALDDRRSVLVGRRRSPLVAATSTILVAVALGACSSGHARHGATPPSTAPPPRSSSTLDPSAAMTFALPTAPTNWNPLAAGAADSDVALVVANVLPSVFVTGPDYSEQLDTNLVTSAVQTSADPQTVVYKINPKAEWSDGQPITAADFVYNWQAQSGQARFTDTGSAPFTPASTAGYSQVANVAETDNDPDTVTATFSTPYADWRSLFANLIPAHIARSVGFDHGFTDPVADLLSGGPFLIASQVPGRSVTLVRNAKFWAAPSALSSVTFDFVPGAPQVVTGFQRGELGGATVAPGRDAVNALRGVSGVKVNVAPGSTWDDLVFNQTNPWLRDPKLRQAIMLAVNRPQMIAADIGAFAQGSPLGNRVFMPQAPAYHDNSGGQYGTGNLTQAKTLLTGAGYSTASGVLTKGGQTVTLRLASGTASLESAELTNVATALGSLGITTTTVPLPSAPPGPAPVGYDVAIVSRSASPVLSGVASDYGDPATVGTANYSGVDDPKVDQLLAQGATQSSGPARDQLFNKLDSTLWADADSLPLFQAPVVTAAVDRYVGIVGNPTADGVTYRMADWGVPVQS